MDNNSWDGFLEAQEFNYKMALKEKEIEGTWSEYSKLLNKLNYKGRMSKILKGAALGISEGCVLCYSVVNHRTLHDLASHTTK